jgi:hypothetical protein
LGRGRLPGCAAASTDANLWPDLDALADEWFTVYLDDVPPRTRGIVRSLICRATSLLNLLMTLGASYIDTEINDDGIQMRTCFICTH